MNFFVRSKRDFLALSVMIVLPVPQQVFVDAKEYFPLSFNGVMV